MLKPELLPSVDEAKVAEEIRKFIEEKKMDLVEWGTPKIECYPPPDSDSYPETRKFSAQWAAAFDYGEKVIDTEGFPEDLIQEFEKVTARVMGLVNSDTAFWAKLHDEMVLLYDRSKEYEKWKMRWKGINKLWYYPEPLTVTTKKGTIRKNKKTGEVIERIMEDNPIRTTTYPAGLVVNIL